MNHDIPDEPLVFTDATGYFATSTGIHRRLTAKDPLYLSNHFLLVNRSKQGDAQAEAAYERRHHAFHEAGHLWAAHLFGVGIDPVSLAQGAAPMSFPCGALALLVKAAGPLAMSVAIEAGRCEFAGVETGYGAKFGSSMDPSTGTGQPSDTRSLPRGQRQRRAETYRDGVESWKEHVEYCLRGGDHASWGLLMNVEWLDNFLPTMLTDWPGIERLAGRLMAGPLLTGNEVHELVADARHCR